MEKIDATDDLVDEKDVKTEVMRSRGAGGQVIRCAFGFAQHADPSLDLSTLTKPNPQCD